MKYTGKQCYGPVMIGLYKKLLMFNIFRNNEFRGLNLGYMMAVNMTIMSITFVRNQCVLLKVMPKLI